MHRDTLDIVMSKRSDNCRQVSWFARAQTATAICFLASMGRLPNAFPFGICLLGDNNWESNSNVEGVIPKWLLKPSQSGSEEPWFRNTVQFLLICAEKNTHNWNNTNSSSASFIKRVASSSDETKSRKNVGGMLQICAATSAILFTSALACLACISRKDRVVNYAKWPLALPFTPTRTS